MKKLRVGVAGLGRLGRVHAANLAFRIPNADLTAACTVTGTGVEYAKDELGVRDVYTDYRRMLAEADIDAVAIVTASADHCEQIGLALDAGKHVFCEKPMGVDLAQCKRAEAAVERHPGQTFMLGFMRRYDKSYAYAKQKIDAGAIGVPYLVKCTAMDPASAAADFIRYAKAGGSGGIFLDLGIHDMDLMRWYLGSEATEAHAMGATFRHPEFRQAGDDETGVVTYRFANGAMGMMHIGRIGPHGYHVETEIVGTEGIIRISAVPEKNLAQLYNTNGVCTECVQSFQERFADAYLAEMEEFVSCALGGRQPGVSVYDGTRSTQMGFAAVESWRTGGIVKIG